jgi:hypothetical protein
MIEYFMGQGIVLKNIPHTLGYTGSVVFARWQPMLDLVHFTADALPGEGMGQESRRFVVRDFLSGLEREV